MKQKAKEYLNSIDLCDSFLRVPMADDDLQLSDILADFAKQQVNDCKRGTLFQKVLCFLGWHNFTAPMEDFMDEFGYVPIDGRMPKTAKCKRCKENYR